VDTLGSGTTKFRYCSLVGICDTPKWEVVWLNKKRKIECHLKFNDILFISRQIILKKIHIAYFLRNQFLSFNDISSKNITK